MSVLNLHRDVIPEGYLIAGSVQLTSDFLAMERDSIGVEHYNPRHVPAIIYSVGKHWNENHRIVGLIIEWESATLHVSPTWFETSFHRHEIPRESVPDDKPGSRCTWNEYGYCSWCGKQYHHSNP